MISLVLVYAGTPTIFANFRTFIQLYLIIFCCYITTLRRTSMLNCYIALLSHAMLQLYVATLHHTSIPHQCRIATALLHCIATTLCHSTCQVRCLGHLGPQGRLLHRMHVTMQQVWTVS